MGNLIVFGIFILAAFALGFLFGFYKREERLPKVNIPTPTFAGIVEAIKQPKEEKPTKEELKANNFYN
jgi:hypothetical protein